MEKVLLKDLNYKLDTDFFIRNLYNEKIVEVAEMMKSGTKKQGKEYFAIRTTTPEIDTSGPHQIKVNIGFDTKVIENDEEAVMMCENGWLIFRIDD